MDSPLSASPAHDPLVIGFIEHADLVVGVVVGALVLGSVVSWAIIIEKVIRIGRLRRAVHGIEVFARETPNGEAADGLLADLLRARDGEAPDDQGVGDLRRRREASMRAAFTAELRRHDSGMSFLATLASTAPFLGLFGTVWGIMQSFSAIAVSKDTSLAVVAPGIAEALFATAIGLGTAIPAVVAYNLSRAALQRCGQRLAAAGALIAKVSASVGPTTPGRS